MFLALFLRSLEVTASGTWRERRGTERRWAWSQHPSHGILDVQGPQGTSDPIAGGLKAPLCSC